LVLALKRSLSLLFLVPSAAASASGSASSAVSSVPMRMPMACLDRVRVGVRAR
jgi:hypothetical protein